MQVTKENVESWITDGSASAMQAAKGDAGKIAAQINADLSVNESHSSTNTIAMSILIKIDGDSRKVEIEGGYGFKVPNLGDKAPKIIREIPDPSQPDLTYNEPPAFDNTDGEDAPGNDEETATEEEEGAPE